MIYRVLADAVLLLHLSFIVFVVLGGFLLARWPRVAWLHLPAVAWGAWVEFSPAECPLTPLEVSLRQLGGEAGFSGTFIDRYVTSLIYPDAGYGVQVAFGVLAVVINVVVYAKVFGARTARSAAMSREDVPTS
jgi:hypothetical protein